MCHYHNNSCVKSKRGARRGMNLWWPIWKECLDENVGHVLDWKHNTENEYLDTFEKEML